MTTAELRPWIAVHWPEVGAELDAGICRPAPVRQVIIPEPGGGERMLGVPRVLDRLIQQAIAQVLRELTSRRWSIAMDERIAEINRFTAGWMGYFPLADTSKVFQELDKWFRRRMRQIRWEEWKIPRARRASLRRLGISESFSPQWGNSSKGYWRIAGSAVLQQALPSSYREDLGLLTLKPAWHRLRPAG